MAAPIPHSKRVNPDGNPFEKHSKQSNGNQMSRGGPREGAGRPAGIANKASIARQAEVAASGMTPLEYLLQIMRDECADRNERMDAAKAAAPYVHPKLAAVEHTGAGGGPILLSQLTDEQLATIATGSSAGVTGT